MAPIPSQPMHRISFLQEPGVGTGGKTGGHSSGHDIGLENGTGLHSWIRKLKSILITIDLENNYEDEHLQYKLNLQYCPSGLLPSTYSYLEKNIIGGGTNKVLMPAELFYLQLRTFFSFTVFKTVLKRRWQSKWSIVQQPVIILPPSLHSKVKSRKYSISLHVFIYCICT